MPESCPKTEWRAHVALSYPEVEAWVREFAPLVSRSPIEKVGPAHIATLKTFDQPLSALEGAPSRRAHCDAARTSSFPPPRGPRELVLRVHRLG